MAYIYQIINDVNQKIYVGKTEFSIEKRFKEHCRDAFKERNEKRPLYAAMRKYGIEHFHIELIEETNNPEEREIYWIEQKSSFKYGYNATLGGDGKKYIDYDLVIQTYQNTQNLSVTAQLLNIHSDSVRNILKLYQIPISHHFTTNRDKYGKSCAIFSMDDIMIQKFNSLGEAAKFAIDNSLTSSTDIKNVSARIGQVCNGKRKTAYKYKWKYI